MNLGSIIKDMILFTDAASVGCRACAAQSRNFSSNCLVDRGLAGDPDGGPTAIEADEPPVQITSISAQPLGIFSLLSARTRDAVSNTLALSKASIWSILTSPKARAHPIR